MINRIVGTLFFALLATTRISAQISPCAPQTTTGLFWPVGQSCETNAHPINGTLGELRPNPGASSVYLHDAIDIAAPGGTSVFAVEAGFAGPVQYPNSEKMGIRIGRFAYLHLRNINPQVLLLRQQGQPIPQGMMIGQSNALNHLHFIQGGALVQGSPGSPVQNPLSQLFNYQDTTQPSIPANIQLVDQASNVLPSASADFMLNVPQLGILATASDAQTPPGSQTVGLYKIGYRVQAVSMGNSYDSGEVFPTVFDQFDGTAQVGLVYETGSTDFYRYRVTNSPTAASFFDTTQLPPGRYQFTVIAEDIAGNRQENSVFGVTPVALTVTTSGTGSGTVASSPTGITSCTGTCNANFPFGANVILTAVPAAGSSFSGWSGDCTGTAPSATLVMTATKNCTATFTQAGLTISVTLAGGGTGNVQSFPSGINCGGGGTVCTASFTFGPGASVSLYTTPATGSFLESWTGCSSVDLGFCDVLVQSNTQNAQITATFLQYALSITSVSCNVTPGANLSNVHMVITAQATGGVGSWVTDDDFNQTSQSCGAWSGPTGLFGISCARGSGQPIQSTFQFTEDHGVIGPFPFPNPVTFPTQVVLSTALPINFQSPSTLVVNGPSCTIP